MDGNNVKKYDEHGQLSCGTHSSSVTAGLLCKVVSGNGKYNLISVWFNKILKIFLCVYAAVVDSAAVGHWSGSRIKRSRRTQTKKHKISQRNIHSLAFTLLKKKNISSRSASVGFGWLEKAFRFSFVWSQISHIIFFAFIILSDV